MSDHEDIPETKSTFMGVQMPFTTQTNVPDTRREQYREQLQLDEKKRVQ